MSLHAMNVVWQRQWPKGTKRLVLLALADIADDHGLTRFPSRPTYAEIARKACCKERRAVGLVAELEREGELRVFRAKGQANSYHILCVDHPELTAGRGGGAKFAPPGAASPESAGGGAIPGENGTEDCTPIYVPKEDQLNQGFSLKGLKTEIPEVHPGDRGLLLVSGRPAMHVVFFELDGVMRFKAPGAPRDLSRPVAEAAGQLKVLKKSAG